MGQAFGAWVGYDEGLTSGGGARGLSGQRSDKQSRDLKAVLFVSNSLDHVLMKEKTEKYRSYARVNKMHPILHSLDISIALWC